MRLDRLTRGADTRNNVGGIRYGHRRNTRGSRLGVRYRNGDIFMSSTLTIDGFTMRGRATTTIANFIATRKALKELATSGEYDRWFTLTGETADGDRTVTTVRIRQDSSIACVVTEDDVPFDGYFAAGSEAYAEFSEKYGVSADDSDETTSEA